MGTRQKRLASVQCWSEASTLLLPGNDGVILTEVPLVSQ